MSDKKLGYFENSPKRLHLMRATNPEVTLCGMTEDHPDLPDLGALTLVDRGWITCRHCSAEIMRARASDVKMQEGGAR